VIPGWHTTIFPPYFVAGAVFSGFAMVQTLMLISRKILKLEQYITLNHIESMNKVILTTGSIVGVAYLTELFISWYSGYIYEQFAFFNRALGPYWWSYFGMMFANVVSPQLFWSKKLRRSIHWTFFLSILINIGMWFERFVIIVSTLGKGLSAFKLEFLRTELGRDWNLSGNIWIVLYTVPDIYQGCTCYCNC
jgi:Ni/Fe-hydrogenase subunit HybB-like protein